MSCDFNIYPESELETPQVQIYYQEKLYLVLLMPQEIHWNLHAKEFKYHSFHLL